MENQKASIKKNGTTYGTYLGSINNLALTDCLMLHIIDLESSFLLSLSGQCYLIFVIILGFGIFSAASTRKRGIYKSDFLTL